MQFKLSLVQLAAIFLFLSANLAFSSRSFAEDVFSLADLESKSEIELGKIYDNKIAEIKSNLGQQCLINNAKELTAFEDQITDPDLKISDEEFKVYIQTNNIEAMPSFLKAPPPETVCYMNKKEFTALRAYTGSVYRTLNSALRNHNKEVLQKYRLFIKFLESALKKLKPYNGFVKRGTDLSLSSMDHHAKNAEVTYNSYTSTSVSNAFNSFGGTLRYVILSQSCRYIAPFSKFLKEEEVLCSPGTVFKVLYLQEENETFKLFMAEVSQSFDIDRFIEQIP